MKTVCIHQPDFAPYIGFFDRLLHSDHFIILDDVQFIRRGWHHRDKIKCKDGPRWLTLSLKKSDYHQLISDVQLVAGEKWIKDNLALLTHWYKKAPFFDLIYPQIESIYLTKYKFLIDFNLALLDLSFRILNINIQTSFSSTYSVKTSSTRRLLDLVLAVNGDNYLTGSGSRDYLDESLFIRSGIKVNWQNFKHPIYSQLHGPFKPMLSCLDLFFNCGDDSSSVIRGL